MFQNDVAPCHIMTSDVASSDINRGRPLATPALARARAVKTPHRHM